MKRNGYPIGPGADLSGADLSGTKGVVSAGSDFREWPFWAWKNSDGVIVYRAGCREWTTYKAARAHYGKAYESDGNAKECLARIAVLKIAAERL